MKYHARYHEFGPRFPRVRMWSSEDVRYGQFTVLDNKDAQEVKDTLFKQGIIVILHTCDGMDENCKCLPMTQEQLFQDY